MVLAGVMVVAAAAVAAAIGVHHACFDPPPPVIRPDPGTPRGEYCSAVLSVHPWITLTVGPSVIALLLASAIRRRVWAIWVVSLVIGVAVIANAIVANELVAALTIWNAGKVIPHQ
jgi:hypothetical protein